LALQLLGAVFVLASVIVGVFSSHASATTPITNGTVELKLSTGGGVATSPLANNQNVNVSVAANSTLSRSSLESAGYPSGVVALKVLECADLDGQTANLPKKPTDCEPATVQASAAVAPDGSFAMQGYTINALPDQQLGPSSGTVCDDAAHQCVLGIFTNYNDFTKPHLFSAPFQVASTTASSGAGATSASGASTSGASPGVSVQSATLANTGSPTLWPWLLGAGFILLVLGSVLRYSRRPASEGRRP
jgi:hypothetical protein